MVGNNYHYVNCGVEVFFVHISVDINIVFVVDVVFADSKSQSATTPTATFPNTDATSQKPGE